ncbi:MAG: alkaline phosphatase D family protein [Fimbriimonadales bacterium]
MTGFALGSFLALTGWLSPIAAADVPLDASATLRRIALGSCADQDRPQPIWDAVLNSSPDVFLFLGDNVYASDPARLDVRAQYAKLGAVPGFQRLRASVPLLAVWGDHDYGVNDGGAEFERKAESQRAFCDFWNLPAEDPRRHRAGNHHAVTVGPRGRRVQFLLLDTRSFRSPLRVKPPEDRRPGRYLPDEDPSKTLLGAEQWKWLEERLREPAELRIVASSIQVVPEDHMWEKWANFPRERDRLFRLVRETRAAGVVFVSGDRHLAEISMMPDALGYPAYDLTASALTQSSQGWRPQEPNRWRVASMNYGNNFGVIEVDWEQPDPEVRLQIRDEAGDVIAQQKLRLSWLRPKS